MTERMPNIGESAWHNILGANDGSGGFLRVTLNDDGTLRPTLGQTITATSLSANTDDWNPTGLSTASQIRVATNAALNLTGIVAQTDGRMILVENVGAFNLNLINASTSSASANRFSAGGAAGDTLPLFPNQTVMMVYNGTDSRWKVLTVANKGLAAPLVAGTAAAGTSRYYSSEDHVHPSEGVVSSTYVPTYTQSGAVTKTTTYAHYVQIGKYVFCWVTLTATGAGTTNNDILVGLPVTAVSASMGMIGNGYFTDASGPTNYALNVFINTTSTVLFNRADTNPTNNFGRDPNFAVASGDVIYMYVMYEAA